MGLQLTKAEMAKALDVSTNTVGAWVKRGCPVQEQGRPGKPYTFDLAAVVSWLTDRPAAAGSEAEAEDAASYRAERAALMRVRRQAAELEYQRQRRAVVDRAKAKRLVHEIGQALAKPWTQWPARVYAEIAAELQADGARVHQVLDRHVHRHLEDLARAHVLSTVDGSVLSPGETGGSDGNE